MYKLNPTLVAALTEMQALNKPSNQINLPNTVKRNAIALDMDPTTYANARLKYLEVYLVANNAYGESDSLEQLILSELQKVLTGPTAVGGPNTGGQVFKLIGQDIVVRFINGFLGLPSDDALILITEDFIRNEHTDAYTFMQIVCQNRAHTVYFVGDSGIQALCESFLGVPLNAMRLVQPSNLAACFSATNATYTLSRLRKDITFFDHMQTIQTAFNFPFSPYDTSAYERILTPLFTKKYINTYQVSQAPMSTILFQTICQTLGAVLKSPEAYPDMDIAALTEYAAGVHALLYLFPFKRRQDDPNSQFYYFTPYVVCAERSDLRSYIESWPALSEAFQDLPTSYPLDDKLFRNVLSFVFRLRSCVILDVLQLLNVFSILEQRSPVYSIPARDDVNPHTFGVTVDDFANGYKLLTMREAFALASGMPLNTKNKATMNDLKEYTIRDRSLRPPRTKHTPPIQNNVLQINDIQPNRLGFIGLSNHQRGDAILENLLQEPHNPRRELIRPVSDLANRRSRLGWGKALIQECPLDSLGEPSTTQQALQKRTLGIVGFDIERKLIEAIHMQKPQTKQALLDCCIQELGLSFHFMRIN